MKYLYQKQFQNALSACALLTILLIPHILKAQNDSDSYTRYELLDVSTQSFRIIYDVSAVRSGDVYYFNTLRKGSEHIVDAVIDRKTGQELEWTIVDGNTAMKNGLNNADAGTDYLQIKLLDPVPENGETRLRIDKTYKDPSGYFKEGDRIVFTRSLGIKRNSVVLPPGYELLSCNTPVQVEMFDSDRVKVSFINVSPGAVNLRIEARAIPNYNKPVLLRQDALPWDEYQQAPEGRDKSHARLNYSFTERAYQDREIVYFLQQPETHSFRLYHDYTEPRSGVNKYLNVVRAGSKASNPSAKILDTGKALLVETLKGDQITAKEIDLGTSVTDDTEVVVIWFDAVKPGQSVRLRIEETYTDPNRYLIYNNELIWDRSFGRPDNAVVLPDGWYLTTNSIPATIDQTEDGKTRLHYINDRPEEIDVFIKARRK